MSVSLTKSPATPARDAAGYVVVLQLPDAAPTARQGADFLVYDVLPAPAQVGPGFVTLHGSFSAYPLDVPEFVTLPAGAALPLSDHQL